MPITMTEEQRKHLQPTMNEVIKLWDDCDLVLTRSQDKFLGDLIHDWEKIDCPMFSQKALDFLSSIRNGFYTEQ